MNAEASMQAAGFDASRCVCVVWGAACWRFLLTVFRWRHAGDIRPVSGGPDPGEQSAGTPQRRGPASHIVSTMELAGGSRSNSQCGLRRTPGALGMFPAQCDSCQVQDWQLLGCLVEKNSWSLMFFAN